VRDENSIIVAPAKRTNFRMIRSKNKLFSKGRIICDIKDDCLFIRLPYFDEYSSICVNSINNVWFKCFLECDIPLGVYLFEDDSTEDIKIIYYGKN